MVVTECCGDGGDGVLWCISDTLSVVVMVVTEFCYNDSGDRTLL